jgi:ABC-2 type transport system ATP-binding protein
VKEIMEEQRQAGRAIVMSTHQMHRAETLCNRIVLIHHGRSVLYGGVEQIKRGMRGNAVLVEGHGELPPVPGVLETRRVESSQNGAPPLPPDRASSSTVYLALAPGTVPQDIFRFLAQQDSFAVERFEVSEPSLEEVFVSVVEGQTSG